MIELGKNIRIRKLDKYCLVLETSHTTKHNKVRWDILGYYSNLESVIYSIISKEVFNLIGNETTKTNLLKVLEEIAKLKESVKELCKTTPM